MGWFFGFKLHLIVNELGDILAFTLTPANGDDRKPAPSLAQRLFGKRFGDKGYLSHPVPTRHPLGDRFAREHEEPMDLLVG